MRSLVLLLAFLIIPWSSANAAADPTLVKIIDGLSMPVDIEFAADGSLYYIELADGGLRRIAPGATAPDPEPLWVAPDLQVGGERGLMGMALASDFETSGAIYVFYTYNGTGTPVDRLSRIVDGEETVLLDDIRTEIMHNSGRILVMPDGTLLVSVGDATLDTIGRQASMHAHDPEEIHGKVLRLNPDGTAAAGNPWGNMVWTKGHRNVYGLARDPTGEIVMATENGPNRGDEVNRLEGGNDYGWPTCAGFCEEDPDCDGCDASGFEPPLFAWKPTIAPTGIAWYDGAFYFTDFNQGRLHRLVQLENGTWNETVVAKLGTRALDVAVGPEGLYLASWESIYRISFEDAATGVHVPATPSPTPATATPTGTAGATPTENVETGGAIRGAPGAAPLAMVALVGALAMLRRR